jgi:hypothetical protein
MHLDEIRAAPKRDVSIIKTDNIKRYGNPFSDSHVVLCVQVGQIDGLIKFNRELRRLTDTPRKTIHKFTE